MTRILSVVRMAFLVSLFVCGGNMVSDALAQSGAGALSGAGAQSAPDAAAAIRQILDAQAIAWNGADSAAWAAPFIDEADFVNILGQSVHGRAKIAALHGRIFAGPFQGSHASITIRQITPIAPGALLVDTMYEVTHYRFLLPGVLPTSEGVLRTLMKYVAVNRGSGWQFMAAQNTAILPGYPPADPPR